MVQLDVDPVVVKIVVASDLVAVVFFLLLLVFEGGLARGVVSISLWFRGKKKFELKEKGERSWITTWQCCSLKKSILLMRLDEGTIIKLQQQ